jgi:CubicO group peptidase (beta-lactamase class C family)
MGALEESVERLAAETRFSGAVHVDRGDKVQLTRVYGLADRGFGVANTVDTRFCIASGTKGSTALTVMSLIAYERLRRTDQEPEATFQRYLSGSLKYPK